MAAYPRKQTVFIFIICALITGGTAFYVYGHSAAETASIPMNNAAAAIASQATTTPIVSSTDWRKEFLASTTGTAFNTKAAKASKPAKEAPLTPVDMLGRGFLQKYGELHQAGLTDNADAVTNAMDEVVQENVGTPSMPKIYSIANVKTVADSASSMSAYKAAMAAISDQYAAHQDEASIAADAMETGDTDKLATIDRSISDYKAMLSHLTSMPVPQASAQNHINLLNGLSALLYSAQAFRHIDTDPLTAFAAVRMNAAGSQLFGTAILNI